MEQLESVRRGASDLAVTKADVVFERGGGYYRESAKDYED